jgi:hypothetical protein
MLDDPYVPRRKTIGANRVVEDSSRESNKKDAAKPEKIFLGKEKRIRFAVTRQ